MRILGLDPSLTNYGWALHNASLPSGVPDRCVDRGRFQTSAKTLFVERYADLRGKVFDLVTRLGVTRIGVEYPVFKDIFSEGMYGLFLYTCEALRVAKCDVVFFSPGQVKAVARELLDRPKGWKMGKPDMVEAAKVDTGGKKAWNHNEADAYWVARSAARFWQFHDRLIGVEDLTATEAKQFAEIRRITRGERAGKEIQRGILYREDERFFRWSDIQGEENGQESEGQAGAEGESVSGESGAGQDLQG